MQIEATSPRNDATTPIQNSDIVEIKPGPPPLQRRVDQEQEQQQDLTTVDLTPFPLRPRTPAAVHEAPTVHRFATADDIFAAMASAADEDDPIDELDAPTPIGRRRSTGRLVLAALGLVAATSWGYGLHRWLSQPATADGDRKPAGLASAKIPIVWTEAEAPKAPKRPAAVGQASKQRSVAAAAKRPSERRPAADQRQRRAREDRGHPLLAFQRRTPAARSAKRAKQRRVQRQLARAMLAMKKRDFRRAKARANAALRLRPVDRRSRRLAIAIKRRATRVQKKVSQRVRRARKAYARRHWWRARAWAAAALRLSPRHPTARRIKHRAQARIRSARVRSRPRHG